MDDCDGCVAEVSAAAARATTARKAAKYCHLCLDALARGLPLPNTYRSRTKSSPYRRPRPPTSYRSHSPSPLSTVTTLANTTVGTSGASAKTNLRANPKANPKTNPPRKRRHTLPAHSGLPPKPSSLAGRPPTPLTGPNSIPLRPLPAKRHSLPPTPSTDTAHPELLRPMGPDAASLLARMSPAPFPECGGRERRRSPNRHAEAEGHWSAKRWQ